MSDNKKQRINSKQKGSSYERKTAKILGTWWDEQFQRTPMSGGLHWKEDNRVVGDIVTPPDSKYPFVTECKKREGWSIEQLMKGSGELESYWTQVTNDAERSGLKPLLVFAKNFSPDYVMLTHIDFLQIARQVDKSVDFNFFVIHKVDHGNRVILLLDDLVKHVTKEDVMRAYNL